MKIKVMIAAHKRYELPEDAVYLPMQVGAAGKESMCPRWQRDDAGENISEKNPSFCELTGHYWMWKHVEADVYGLCHYRRYFAARRAGPRRSRILCGAEMEKKLRGVDAVVPRKRHYFVETRQSQYAHAHHAADLACAEAVLREKYPDYLPDWQYMLSTRSGHIFNMFIMRREWFMAYSAWLFDVLFAVEARLDISAYDDKRVFGYLAERLLDVWLRHNGLRVRECPVVNLENQHWGQKALRFLQRKLAAR